MALPSVKDITEIMDLRKLRSFITIADYSNFSEAAEHLYICQSALSRQISSLEEDLGVTLLIRSNRLVKLSPAGVVLYNEAKNLIAKTDDIIEKTRNAGAGIRGCLKIGYTGIEKSILPAVVREFHQMHPDILLNVQFCNDSNFRNAILNGTLDVGCMLEFTDQQIEGIVTQHLFDDKLCIVLSKEHPLANKEDLTLVDMRNERFICFSMAEGSFGYEDMAHFCLKHNFYPKIIGCSSDLESLLMQVESGIGVSFLVHNAATAMNHKLKFVPIDSEDATAKICIAWNSQNNNPCLSLFTKIVGDFVARRADVPLLN